LGGPAEKLGQGREGLEGTRRGGKAGSGGHRNKPSGPSRENN